MASNGDPGRTTSGGPRPKEKETLPKAIATVTVVTVAPEVHKANGATEVTTHKRVTGKKTWEINITQRERSQYNELMTRIAQLPTQIMRQTDYKFQ